MGASMSSSFLYKMVAIVEMICSSAIAIFGVNTFILFNQMDDTFQEEKEMILYSSIVAVAQSVLTLFSTIFLMGCHHTTLQKEIQAIQQDPNPKRTSRFGHHPHTLRRKAIAPTWILWTVISISLLLFVFIAPLHYCIQDRSDREKLEKLPFQDGAYVSSTDNARLGLCYSEAPHLFPIRRSLKDLYSFSILSIIFKSLFVLAVYRKWRRELRNGRKVVIYIEGPESSGNNENESSISGDPKLVISGPTGSSSIEGSELMSTSGGVNENGEKGSETTKSANLK